MRREQVARYTVFCGVDVGKEAHCCRAVAPDGETELLARVVPNDEAAISAFLDELSSLGAPLVVVDQHSGFGSLLAACASAAGVALAHVPPSRFARLAAVRGEGKDDRADALTLALAAAETPRFVDEVPEPAEAVAQAKALIRYRRDLVGERTRAYNRLHDALSRACPPLERALSGPRLHASCALQLLARYGAAGLAGARRRDVERWAAGRRGLGPAAVELAGRLRDAARSHGVAVPGAAALEEVIRSDARRISELEAQCRELSERAAELCAPMPEAGVACSLPGVGPVWGQVIVVEVGDVSRFRSASALAAYCGLGRCPRDSGKTVAGRRRRSYNRALHAAMVESARAAARRPGPDRDYYEKKLREGKSPRQALHALARKRVSILYAMLKNMEPYGAA